MDLISKLLQMYKLSYDDDKPTGIRNILAWLDKFPQWVRLEWKNDCMYLSYMREAIQKTDMNMNIASIERGFKHLRPCVMKVVQTSHTSDWKVWKFIQTTRKPIRVQRSIPPVIFTFSPKVEHSISQAIEMFEQDVQ